jgi:hypothetical protein
MGDRIHEQRSMKPPRCPGRRKNPCSGLYTDGQTDRKEDILYRGGQIERQTDRRTDRI